MDNTNSQLLEISPGRTRTHLLRLDPARCRPWKFHNRDLAWLTSDRCRSLIDSIRRNGQNDPALVREIKYDPNYDYEIIYGVRRWFACSQIPNHPLLARITDADDKTCMILMHTENADSKDITEFERAFSFAQQLKSGVFKSQVEMAELMGLSQGYISKLIKAAEIFEYPWIQNLFNNKLDVSVKYAYELSVLLKNPEIFNHIKKEAEAMLNVKVETGQSLSSADVLKKLINFNKSNDYHRSKSIIISSGNKEIVSCRKNKLGNLILYIDSKAKELSQPEIEAACLKVVRDHIFN
jgi:ParB family transcriptional regulator, chromosome partitioning protein